MKLCTSLVAVLLVLVIGLSPARAVLYWDINGVNAGATDDGGGAAPGNWGTDTFWSTDPDGLLATAAWTPNELAVFSAGMNATGTSIIAGTATTNGFTIQEGFIVLTGTITMSSNPGQFIILENGTTLSTNSSARVVIPAAANAATYQLNGPTATLQSTNPGFAGSFVDVDSKIVLNGGGTFDYTTPNQINILQTATTVTGTGPLTKTGAGVLSVAGTMTYSGATIVNDGELRVRTTANRLPIGTDVTVNSPGIFNLNGVNQEVGSIAGTGNVGTGNATLTLGGSANTTLDGALKDTANAGASGTTSLFGKLIRNGSGVTTFNGQNDIQGSVTINSGGIVVGATGSLCGDVADLIVNGGTLTMNNSAETVENWSGTGGIVQLASGHVLTANPSSGAAGNSTYSGLVEGAGGIRKDNTLAGGISRTLTLAGANTYSGGTEVSGGRLHSNSASGTGSGAVTINNNGVLAGNGTVTGAITVQSGGHLGGGLGDGAGATLTAAGAVTVEAGGGLDFNLGAPGGALAGDYNNNGVVDGADYVVWRNDPASFGGDPAGYNTWRGNFGATGGGGQGTADKIDVTTANGLNLQAGSLLTILGGATAPNGTYTVLQYNGSYTGSLASAVVNNATGFDLVGSVVDNTAADTFEVTVSSTAQDREFINAAGGNWSAAAADAGNWSPAGQPNGPGAIGRFLGTGGGTVTIADSDKTLGTMTLNKASGYTIAATGPNRLNLNTYSGNAAINVANGSHAISAPVIISKTTDVTVTNGGDTLTVSGSVANVGGIAKAGAGSLDISGNINGAGTFTNSAGTTTLSAANTYSGVTTNAAGATLNVTNAGLTSGTGTAAVTNNGTLNVADGRITGAVTTNAGATTNITGGTTSEANLSATAIVAGTLTGTGTAAGITLNSGGHLEPGGVGAVGGMTATGTVTFNSGSIFDIDVSSGGADLFTMTSATATTGGLVINAGATMVIHDAGGLTDGLFTILDYNVASNAVETNWAVSGPAGHTYTLIKDTGSTLINLQISPAGLGSGGAVPEPASIGLVAIALMALAGRRSRRA